MPDPRRVLTIDDEPLVRELLNGILSEHGFDVLQAEDGRTGIEMAQKEEVDVILLDVYMPAMDGREVAQRLKQNPRTRQIPIIILTASAGEEEVVLGLEAGADEFVSKSVPPAELAARVRAMLRTRDLQEELIKLEQERHEAQLAFARDVQKQLLPPSLPEVPGLDLAVRYQPCGAIGGDFYDCFAVEDGRLCTVLADAEGHGLSAALLMATVRAYVHASFDGDHSPAQLLERVNRLVCRDRGYSGFLPMICVYIDAASGVIQYANAGHENPIVIKAGERQLVPLKVTGPILGIQESLPYSNAEILLDPGDILACFTDGLIEGANRNGSPFGRDRIQTLASELNEEEANTIADRIVDSWADHTDRQEEDDMTLILSQWRP